MKPLRLEYYARAEELTEAGVLTPKLARAIGDVYEPDWDKAMKIINRLNEITLQAGQKFNDAHQQYGE